MRLEVITLLELDETAERARLKRAFKGAERKALLAILEDFVAARFNAAMAGIAALPKEWRECLHPVIWKVAAEAWTRVALEEKFKDADFSSLPDHVRLMGGIDGSALSREGLSYPKVRVLPS